MTSPVPSHAVRLPQLLVGLILYGVAIAFFVRADVGLEPWTVFAQGVSLQTGLGIGWVTNLVGAAVLLLWIPLRQRPGVGTVLNVALVGTSIEIGLAVLPVVDPLAVRIGFGVFGMLLLAVASGLYLGAHYGPGPRDGLMTGLHRRTGRPVWMLRAGIELTVLAVGWLLGGSVGPGTVVFALGIGPLVGVALPIFDVTARRERARVSATLGV
ncbi:YitT family protein [Kineococcus gynurae]|uniref:YitT family protein n=1 Tax=Kineococcus gynurae TaxID=452979 RepID=A0ABV5LS35_9ACTN